MADKPEGRRAARSSEGMRGRWLVPLLFLACFNPDDDTQGGTASSGETLGDDSEEASTAADEADTGPADSTAADTEQNDDSSAGGCAPAIFGEARFGDECFSP